MAEAATIPWMDNPVGGEIHQKNDRFKKFEDWREHVDQRAEKCLLFEGSEVSA